MAYSEELNKLKNYFGKKTCDKILRKDNMLYFLGGEKGELVERAIQLKEEGFSTRKILSIVLSMDESMNLEQFYDRKEMFENALAVGPSFDIKEYKAQINLERELSMLFERKGIYNLQANLVKRLAEALVNEKIAEHDAKLGNPGLIGNSNSNSNSNKITPELHAMEQEWYNLMLKQVYDDTHFRDLRIETLPKAAKMAYNELIHRYNEIEPDVTKIYKRHGYKEADPSKLVLGPEGKLINGLITKGAAASVTGLFLGFASGFLGGNNNKVNSASFSNLSLDSLIGSMLGGNAFAQSYDNLAKALSPPATVTFDVKEEETNIPIDSVLVKLTGLNLSYNREGYTQDGRIVFTEVPTPVEWVKDNGVFIPTRYKLEQNYPNPLNPATRIRFSVPKAGNVFIGIYNVLGQEVKTLVNQSLDPGVYEVGWDGTTNKGIGVASGIYLYSMKAGDYLATKKMVKVDGGNGSNLDERLVKIHEGLEDQQDKDKDKMEQNGLAKPSQEAAIYKAEISKPGLIARIDTVEVAKDTTFYYLLEKDLPPSAEWISPRADTLMYTADTLDVIVEVDDPNKTKIDVDVYLDVNGQLQRLGSGTVQTPYTESIRLPLSSVAEDSTRVQGVLKLNDGYN